MKEIAFQKKNGVPVPFTDEDAEKWAEFKENQVSIHRVSGARKQRSWQQLKMLHACLKTVAENTENPSWNTLEKAKFSLKIALDYIDNEAIVVDKKGNIHMQYRSFGYQDLGHMEACKLFDRAWPILAGVIGITEYELLENSQQ